eukprot:g56095.t1
MLALSCWSRARGSLAKASAKTVAPTTHKLLLSTPAEGSLDPMTGQPYRGKQQAARPISPHIQIYKFPLAGFSSGFHRATGAALTIGFTGMAGVAIGTGDCDLTHVVVAFQHEFPLIATLSKPLVAFPFVYHYLAAARHIYWDSTAKGLDLHTLEMSSRAVIGGGVFLALCCGFITLPAA